MKFLAITTIIITMALLSLSCEDGIITEDDRPIGDIDTIIPSGVRMANYSYIQDSVISKTCAVAGCHFPNQQPPNLSKENFPSLIGTGYIKPGDPQASLILTRMSLEEGNGLRMPPFPAPPHPKPVLDSIAKWIEDGAKLD